MLNNRMIKVRFATHGAALTVRNLLPVVTNELLEQVRLKKSQEMQEIKSDKNVIDLHQAGCSLCSSGMSGPGAPQVIEGPLLLHI